MVDRQDLPVWVVTERPADYPDFYVALRWNGMTNQPTEERLFSATLEGLRAKLPRGLFRLPRQPGDEFPVVEWWL